MGGVFFVQHHSSLSSSSRILKVHAEGFLDRLVGPGGGRVAVMLLSSVALGWSPSFLVALGMVCDTRFQVELPMLT